MFFPHSNTIKRKSTSFTHVSALLHAFVGLTSSEHVQQQSKDSNEVEEEDEVLSVMLFLCQWKVPKKRKESNKEMSKVVFEKHLSKSKKNGKQVSLKNLIHGHQIAEVM